MKILIFYNGIIQYFRYNICNQKKQKIDAKIKMAFGLLKLKSSKVVINNRPTVPKVPTKKCILAMNVIYFKISLQNYVLFL